MERTVLVIKPDAVFDGKEKHILDDLEGEGFYIAQRRSLLFSAEAAVEYVEKRGGESEEEKKEMRELLTSSPSTVVLLTCVGAIARLRSMIGHAHPDQARARAPASIRARYGTTAVRNAVDCSNTQVEAEQDVAQYFPSLSASAAPPSPFSPLQGAAVQPYLVRTQILPGVVEGLSQLCIEQPKDAFVFLSQWLLDNRPKAGSNLGSLSSFSTSLEVYNEPVLSGHVLKKDRFPHIHALPSDPTFDGSWNFRKSDGDLPVFGIGQSEGKGIKAMAELLRDTYKEVVCVNLREEPIVFIDGIPHAIKEADNLTENIDHLFGIEGDQLESVEARLKKDVEEAAGMRGGKLEIMAEKEGYEMVKETETIADDAVKTPRELYSELAVEGYPVRLVRIPITDETAPEEKDFDDFVRLCKGLDESCALVFNCHMGRGRTTTGMVIATIFWKAVKKATREPQQPLDPFRPNLENGEFAVVVRLVQTVPNGRLIKQLLDDAIDECAGIQNLRTAIVKCKQRAQAGKEEEGEEGTGKGESTTSSEFWIGRGTNYLERYVYLFLFAAYCLENAPVFTSSFSDWMHEHWSYKRAIRKIVLH
mmetsp:Transcript_8636/g.23207  ORF Transcript_8636/g.23207 Transcript_8636/m.23207 type:complete len:590 (-) Transcript_8636:439-2208(-)|eukprot:CAMPEP_0113902414 /NCGR_PEP_ID=MMETSP0780_2-20120614/21831_1 /TAXON_ID=652834 /ORGANISM="Palpitomonas bilix" /LENGTH=589 /DNA_ID=CAMNT_0000895205 /DNA_START=128 /DNA_END=1897 /DNA_ORIENTATION=+ /assembly_acc=CAM_ASM_000599